MTTIAWSASTSTAKPTGVAADGGRCNDGPPLVNAWALPGQARTLGGTNDPNPNIVIDG